MKTELFVELGDCKTDSKFLIEMSKEIWKSQGNKVKDLKSLQLYFKPDESKCYYVMNSNNKGFFAV